jgi:hypothetical protein
MPGQVAQNLVQPSPQMADLGAGLKRRQRSQKGLLDEILGPLPADALCVGV